MYGETNLGANDEAMLTFFKTPMNKAIFDALKKHVYPEFAVQFTAVENTNSQVTPPVVEEPEINPETPKRSSRR